jgi:hypothetical protein
MYSIGLIFKLLFVHERGLPSPESTAVLSFLRALLQKYMLGVLSDRLCGLVVRVLGYRSGGPGSIPGTTRKKK